MKNNPYVQYGCGYSVSDSWRNFDASLTLRFERLPLIGNLYTKNESRFPEIVEYGDIVKGLPVVHDSCDGVYCSHVLEHLSLDDFRTALHNTFSILRPGGIFRLVLPDLEFCAKKYLENTSDDAALVFMSETSFGLENKARSIKDFIYSWFGNSQHLWMWDYKSIKQELVKAGFCDVRRAYYDDSSDPKFEEVECKDRWDDCLGVECSKPH